MKRVLTLFLASAISLALMACGKDTASDIPTQDEKQEQLSQTQEENQGQSDDNEQDNTSMTINITCGGKTVTATLSENSSGKAFREKLKEGPVTIEMHDYGGFEKVGPLGFSIVRNDEQITTEPGDIILYLGSNVCLYYDTNNWDFTRLGKMNNVTQDEIKSFLNAGGGNITVTFSLKQ